MKIEFCGASMGVTGSCHLITTQKHKILLDCGQFQGGKAMEAMNAEPFPFDPSEIDYMILSHAHIDHCGRIPLLVKRGFKGDIYCTDATADLLDVMLKDSGYIHEKEAEWQNRKNERAGRSMVEPLYTYSDAVAALKFVKSVLYDQLVELNEEMRIVFNDAGHILGSAITELWVIETDKTGNEDVSKIVFSGDLGVVNRPLLRDPTIIKSADYVIMESTYGNRLHPENATSITQLLDIVLKTVKRGGTVVIPSFAVGRTQELIFEFNRIYREDKNIHKQLENVKVYVDSPMATTATEVFKRNAQVFDEETRGYLTRGDNPLDFENLRFARTTDESKALNMSNDPKIIISASGMCEAGRIRHHLKHNLWDKRASVIFVGYQAEGTLGKLLLNGAEKVDLFGEEVQVNAEIYNLEGFSAHADRDGLLHWLAGFKKAPKEIFLVHGELEAKEDFAALVKEKLGYNPIVVRNNSEFIMAKDTIVNKAQFVEEVINDEKIMAVRNRIADVHRELESILYNTDLAVGAKLPPGKLVRINNSVIELEKYTMQLGSTVSDDQ